MNKQKKTKRGSETFYAVTARFKRMGTSLYRESKKLGFHHELGKRALLGETQSDEALERRKLLIMVSKGQPVNSQEEPK